MTKRAILVMLVAIFAVAVAGFAADDANMGTWKLNEAKSKFPDGATKNNTVVVEAAGGSIKVTIDGVTGDGKAFHSEWTGHYDGKDYPVSGDPGYDMRSYKKVDDHTLTATLKKDGKVIGMARIHVTPDGKTGSVEANATDAMGKKMTSKAIYDRQ
ncbi:MAG TPA: hypothetical protein VIH76_15580 [Candidatus Acidoferrales bacterium]